MALRCVGRVGLVSHFLNYIHGVKGVCAEGHLSARVLAVFKEINVIVK